MTVTNPGAQSSAAGSAITTLANSATDSSSGTTLTWSATGLPTGLTLNGATGAITGTPTTSGTSNVTLTATDNLDNSGSASFTWTVSVAASIVSVTNPGSKSSTAGSAISTLTATATDTQTGASFTWSATGLPTGLSVSSSGHITGTPTVAGTYNVTLTATDGSGNSGSASFTWTVAGDVSVTNPGAQSSAAGSAITTLANSATDSSSGTTITWSATWLPTGLVIAPATGSVTGTPTTSGSYSVTLTATDNLGYAGSASFTWIVTGAVSVANPGNNSSTTGSVITPLLSTATDTQTGASFTWSATGLPTGLVIAPATGTITGTPTSSGIYKVTITAADNLGSAGSTGFTWTVNGAVSVANPGNKSGPTSSAITPLLSTATDTQTGASFTWSATGLPTGLVINAGTGTITGTPTVAGTYNVTLTTTDGSGNSGSASFTWTIVGSVAVTNPGGQSSPGGTAINTLSLLATDTQAGASFIWAETGLPTGLALSSSGHITGTPTVAGSDNVTVIATDGSAYSGSASFTWTVVGAVSVTNPGAQSSATGSAITTLANSATDSSSGATLTWSATGLPTGLALNDATGAITGTPTVAETYAVTLTATDNLGYAGSASFTWTVSAQTIGTGGGGGTSPPTTGSITGSVSDAADPTGISGACVYATSSDGNSGEAITAVDGKYSIDNLPVDTYFVRFDATCSGSVTSSDLAQWYADATTQSEATPVVVSGGVTTAGIDASLVLVPVSGTVPDVPFGVSAIAGDASARISWSVPTDNGSAITSFTVVAVDSSDARRGGERCIATGASATSCVVDNLTNGDRYSFTVFATNLIGSSATSKASKRVTPMGAPEAPFDVRATGSIDGPSVTVSWTAPSSDEGSPIASFNARTSGGHTCSTTGATSCVMTGLVTGATYVFSVSATNSVGSGPSSRASDQITIRRWSAISLSVASDRIIYGQEQLARLSVKVYLPFANNLPAPTGSVMLTAGTRHLCRITLVSGLGTCWLSARELGVGTHLVSATYSGSDEYFVSTTTQSVVVAGPKRVRPVVKTRSTWTFLELSRSSVAYGSEQLVRLSVRTTSHGNGTETGTVTIREANKVLCTLTLRNNGAWCRLSSKQLTVGTHDLVASYEGSSLYLASSGSTKLTIVSGDN